MAEIKKYLDTVALGALVDQIKAKDADTLAAAKDYAEKLGVNYDAAGAAAGVQANLELEIARAKAAEEANSAAAKKAQDEVDALEELVGALPEGSAASSVVEYVNIKTAGIATEGAMNELNSQFGTLKGRVDVIEGDYLKAADKAEVLQAVEGVQGSVNTLSGTHAADKKTLEDAIALKADITALEGVSAVANAAVKQSDYDAKMTALEGADTRIEGLVTAEVERATGVEAGLEARIEAMEVFWDATEDNDGIVNKLKEIQDYIAGDESGAAEMAGNIQANTQAIAAMDTAYKAADVTLQGNIDALAEVVGTKAAASVVEGIDGRVEVLEGEMDAVEGRVGTVEGEIDALQALFGEGDGTVADMIADAVKVETEARAAAIAEVQEDADKGIADAAAALKAAQEAAASATALNNAMDARVQAVEAAKHTHANKAELDLIASGDKAKWDAAAAIAHEHSNKSIIDGITEAKVTLWDTVSSKASQADLAAQIERIDANASAIGSFSAITSDEVNALFA